MKFGTVPLAEAEGCLLAHSLPLKDQKLSKGHVLTLGDLQAMADAGHSTVTVAQLEAGDVGENEAAHALAHSLADKGFVVAEPFTGRCNIHAAHAGLFKADVKMVNAINAIHPSITVATLADDTVVETGRMVATVKIIPFAVAQTHLDACIAVSTSALANRPFGPNTIALVATQLPGLKTATMDKTARILADRLGALGNTLGGEVRCAHAVDAVAHEIKQLATRHDLIILFGASAVVDEGDVLPAAIRQAGGLVDYLGMPVDPGNLLLVGHLGETKIIGAPGCARSSVENGFDWVLARLVAGEPVDADYISGLGVGGLLMEITTRPQPREPEDT